MTVRNHRNFEVHVSFATVLPDLHYLFLSYFSRVQKYYFLKSYIFYTKLKKNLIFFYDIRPIFFYTCVLFKQNGKNGFHAIIKNVSFTAIFHRNACKRYPF